MNFSFVKLRKELIYFRAIILSHSTFSRFILRRKHCDVTTFVAFTLQVIYENMLIDISTVYVNEGFIFAVPLFTILSVVLSTCLLQFLKFPYKTSASE